MKEKEIKELKRHGFKLKDEDIKVKQFPRFIICPSCKKEIRIEMDEKGMLKTDDLLTMRIRTPLYVLPEKTTDVRLDISICSQCRTIIGLGRKI
ncbi:MAG: hypothetical protein ACFFA3_20535 [Promethearchaeota archaeon]